MIENNETTVVDLLKKDGVDPIPVKPYKFRKLSAKDIGPMLKIAKKIDIKRLKNALTDINLDEIMNLSKKDEEVEENTEDRQDLILKVGGNLVIEAIPILLDALDNCIDDINKLLANVANMEVEQVENLDLDIYFNMIYDFINKEEFAGFTKVVSRFLKSEN